MNEASEHLEQALREIFLFESLDAAKLRVIASISALRELRKGEHLFHAGDRAQYFYGILEGACKLYRVSPSGDEFIVHIQQRGDLLAEAAMFDVKRYPVHCVALEDSTVVRVSAIGFVALLMEHPDLSLELLNAYSRRLRAFVLALEDVSLRDVKTRFANFLLRNMKERDGLCFCELSFSKKELARLLGTIPETLSRTLREFRTHGLIEDIPDGFLIPEPRALQAWGSDRRTYSPDERA